MDPFVCPWQMLSQQRARIMHSAPKSLSTIDRGKTQNAPQMRGVELADSATTD